MMTNKFNYLRILLIFLLSFLGTCDSFLMSCKNVNSFHSVMIGDSLEFHCTSDKPFDSCTVQKEVNRKISYCNYEFHQPLQFLDEISRGKELKRVGWQCKLDPHEPYRIRVLEKNKRMVCHLKINSAKLSGMKIFLVFCSTSNIILKF